MGNKSSVCKETAAYSERSASPCESLELLNTLQCLSNGINNLKSVQKKSREILRERKKIIKKLRDMADELAKTHSNVLIADRVGTGVGIGSGLLFIGGLVAAPFTAGVSLALTISATTTGIMGVITSAGANITGFVMTKNSLDPLQKELDEHFKHLVDISTADPQYLVRAARFRPSLEMLAKLSEPGWIMFLNTIQKAIPHALKGDQAQVQQVVNHAVDPEIKNLLQTLQIPLDPASLTNLCSICSYILAHIRSIKQAVVAFLNFLNKPELVSLCQIAMVYTNSTAKSITATTQEVSQIKSAFKGTPMAMTKTVRYVAGAATTAFIILDVIHMVRICKETGETPTVQNLRKMADDLENEFQFTGETEEEPAESDETDADE